MSKIVVTGGTGYIGSHTVVELQNEGFEVIIVDNLSNSNIDVLSGIEKINGIRPVFENIDCVDYVNLDRMFERHGNIDGIIHFAAYKAVGESVEKPLMYYRNNLVSLINVLQLMPVHKIKNIVFSSSCTVYGQPDELPVTENAPIKPAMSPYGNTKQICEEIIRDTAQASPDTFKAILLRYFNPIGAHQSAHIGELPIGIPNNLLPFVTQTAIGIRQELKVFGNDYNTSDGSCIRDYINVIDLARAHVIALKRMMSEKMTENIETFNLGTGRGLSVLDIINDFERVNDVKIPYQIVGRRKGDIEKVWADATLANDVLGWQAKETIDDTLRSAWEWEKHLSQIDT